MCKDTVKKISYLPPNVNEKGFSYRPKKEMSFLPSPLPMLPCLVLLAGDLGFVRP